MAREIASRAGVAVAASRERYGTEVPTGVAWTASGVSDDPAARIEALLTFLDP